MTPWPVSRSTRHRAPGAGILVPGARHEFLVVPCGYQRQRAVLWVLLTRKLPIMPIAAWSIMWQWYT